VISILLTQVQHSTQSKSVIPNASQFDTPPPPFQSQVREPGRQKLSNDRRQTFVTPPEMEPQTFEKSINFETNSIPAAGTELL